MDGTSKTLRGAGVGPHGDGVWTTSTRRLCIDQSIKARAGGMARVWKGKLLRYRDSEKREEDLIAQRTVAIKECYVKDMMEGKEGYGYTRIREGKTDAGLEARKRFFLEATALSRATWSNVELLGNEDFDIRRGVLPVYNAMAFYDPRQEIGAYKHWTGPATYLYAMPWLDGVELGKLENSEDRRAISDPAVISVLYYRMLKILDILHSVRVPKIDWEMATIARRDGKDIYEPLIHRDIKPGNIMLARSPRDGYTYPVLVDYGGIAAGDSMILTPGYDAPEQSRSGAQVTHAVDMYGLAATFYELMTGKTIEKGHERRKFVEKGERDPLKPDELLAQSDVERFVNYGKKCGYEDVVVRGRNTAWGERFLSLIVQSLSYASEDRPSVQSWMEMCFPKPPPPCELDFKGQHWRLRAEWERDEEKLPKQSFSVKENMEDYTVVSGRNAKEEPSHSSNEVHPLSPVVLGFVAVTIAVIIAVLLVCLLV